VNILFITKSLSVREGGSVTSIYMLAKSLSLQHTVTIWTTDHDIYHLDPSLYEVCKIRVFRCLFGGLFFSTRAGTTLSREICPFDVINVFGFWTVVALLSAWVAPTAQGAVFLHTQGIFLPVALAHHPRRKRLAGALFARRLVNRFSAAIVCNMVEVPHTRQWGFRKPVYVLQNPVVPMAAQRGVFRRALDLPDNIKIVAYLNRFDPIKRVLELCRAFRLVQDSAGDVVFLLAGDATTSYGQEVQAYAASSGLRARFLGHLGLEEKWELLADADVLCQYSAQEAHSNALTEALAAGVPVVASRSCNFARIGSEGAGFVIDSVEEMADATLRLLVDEDLRRRTSSNAFRLAQNYTPEAVAEAYARIVIQHTSSGAAASPPPRPAHTES
jgi:glycosyltransferase involved in cell wall biosynthesis